MNYLYLGDCLNVLRDSVPDESVDLIYIDPPFNSKRDYNIFFDDKEIQTQRVAFEDTWSLKNIQDSLQELHVLTTDKIYKLLTTYKEVAPHAFPYLVMMSLRILELHRVLKPTGSFYLHCDPTMSHYLKTIADLIFTPRNYVNEIVWQRVYSHNDPNRFGKIHDIIFFYSKSERFQWNKQYTKYDEKYLKMYSHDDGDGRLYKVENTMAPGGRGPVYNWNGQTRAWRYTKANMQKLHDAGLLYYTNTGFPKKKVYLDEMPGKPLQDIWSDINVIAGRAQELLGYPTQKPKALLERIIQSSSNEGDIVLDAFCGCGTTVDAAEGLNRQWIGIDISPIALSLIHRRLRATYKTDLSKYEVRGTPGDEQSAIKLWEENAFAFQDWWLTEFEVFSTTEGTRGPDRGIDGLGQYLVDKSEETIRVAYQVKGGKVSSKDIDALMGVLTKHKCELGVLLTINEPTKPMLDAAASAGFLEVPGFQYPRIQILTLKDFFQHKKPKLPSTNITFRAAKFKGKKSQQIDLGL